MMQAGTFYGQSAEIMADSYRINLGMLYRFNLVGNTLFAFFPLISGLLFDVAGHTCTGRVL